MFPVVIVCDDIRKEINRKRTIVGAYSSDIIVDRFPASFPISFYLHFLPTSDDPVDIEFFYSVEGESLATAKAKLTGLKAGDPAGLDLPQTFFPWPNQAQ